jgi:hypothetical protein
MKRERLGSEYRCVQMFEIFVDLMASIKVNH